MKKNKNKYERDAGVNLLNTIQAGRTVEYLIIIFDQSNVAI